ncbi:MAG TPA: hypothetical protein VI603_05825 [Saprospiraceae bacterium]|nr:hypothetical protein [Saprospiraceae bacterium]
MKDMESQFLEHSKTIRITPHARTWERLEAKLHAQRGHRRLFTARLIGIAAAILCLVAVSAGLFFYTRWQDAENSMQYSLSLEELQVTTAKAESIYDVERIRRYYIEVSRHN